MKLLSVTPNEFGSNGGVDITLNGGGFGKTPDGFHVKIMISPMEFPCETKSWTKNQIVCSTLQLIDGQGELAVRSLSLLKSILRPGYFE